jgi:hypothetical protein
MKANSRILREGWRPAQSAIIQNFATKYLFFMFLGACRLKNRVLGLVVGLCAAACFLSCGSSKSTAKASGLPERLLASQGVSSPSSFPGLVIINGTDDTLPRVGPISAGNAPGMMAISPSRNIVAAFDSSSNTVHAVDTTKEQGIGSGVRLPGSTSSFIVPTANQIGYAAVPTATVNGFAFIGAVEQLFFASNGISTIAVNNAQTVVSNSTGTQLLVFSADSDSMTVLNPLAAVPPVDTSCYTNPPNAVCTIVPGFDRPVYAVINGNTAYVLNCGAQCGGTKAGVVIFDLPSLTITKTIPVDAATMAVLNNSTLYVAGTSPTNHACTGQSTAATTCGRLDIVDLNAGKVVGTAVITDGYHVRMDLNVYNQLFIGARDCTNIGDANNPVGEVRGCLTIFRTADGSVVIPPDNGNVDGLQGFTTRTIEYVAEGGNLRVYDTRTDTLYINTEFLTQGTINIVGYVGDVKAVDFF